jgi:soluble lytic murein transglycosylase
MTKTKSIVSNILFLSIGIAIAVTILVSPLHADIYMYIDSEGVLHFTNTPTTSDYKLYIRERPRKKTLIDQMTSKYDPIIMEATETLGLSFPLVKAMIRVESNFDPTAVSRKGALGLMQIMPNNLEVLDISDPFDPRQNIMGGSAYFKQMMERYEGKLPLALAAYNAGPSVVDRYGDIPPIKETEDYVQKVMKLYYALRDTEE